MTWEAIGALGEITGALAVVITLLYLARQVRHARREQQIAAIRANRTERREYYTTARDSPYLPGILSKLNAGGDLSPEEEQRLTFHYSAAWSVLYSEWIQSQLDLSGEFATSSQFIIRITIALPGSLEWFREYGAHLYPSRFIAYVMQIQDELDTPPGNDLQP